MKWWSKATPCHTRIHNGCLFLYCVFSLDDDIETIRLVFHVRMPPHNADCVQMFNLFHTRWGIIQTLAPINRRWTTENRAHIHTFIHIDKHRILLPIQYGGKRHFQTRSPIGMKRTNLKMLFPLLYSKI